MIKHTSFNDYCHKCKHSSKKAMEDPCYECLRNGFDFNIVCIVDKPMHFEEVKVSRKRRKKYKWMTPTN